MAMPWDLEDWLTETGDRVVRKIAASGFEALTPLERLIYEIWVFDTETRNGGVRQYFGNRGTAQWQSMRAISHGWATPKLKQFMDDVDRLIAGNTDPYAATVHLNPPIEEVYWSSHQIGIVAELRSLVLGSQAG